MDFVITERWKLDLILQKMNELQEEFEWASIMEMNAEDVKHNPEAKQLFRFVKRHGLFVKMVRSLSKLFGYGGRHESLFW